jgi:hypothetical protein
MAVVIAAARTYLGGSNGNVELRALWAEASAQTATCIRLKFLSNGVEEDSHFCRDARSGGQWSSRRDRGRRPA